VLRRQRRVGFISEPQDSEEPAFVRLGRMSM
jgi:hypothetical protein